MSIIAIPVSVMCYLMIRYAHFVTFSVLTKKCFNKRMYNLYCAESMAINVYKR